MPTTPEQAASVAGDQHRPATVAHRLDRLAHGRLRPAGQQPVARCLPVDERLDRRDDAQRQAGAVDGGHASVPVEPHREADARVELDADPVRAVRLVAGRIMLPSLSTLSGFTLATKLRT